MSLVRKKSGMGAGRVAAFTLLAVGLALTVARSALVESPLHKAIRTGDLPEVESLLDAGVDVNAETGPGLVLLKQMNEQLDERMQNAPFTSAELNAIEDEWEKIWESTLMPLHLAAKISENPAIV